MTTSRLALLVCILALDCSLTPSIAIAQRPRVPIVSPSNILVDINAKMKQPGLSSKELALYANQLQKEKGFDYSFDVWSILKKRDRILSLTSAKTQSFTITEVDGRRRPLKFTVESSQDSLCGERISQIPSVQVTRKEMLVIIEGKRYRLRRPAAFLLDEAELVDVTMKKVRRTWQLPYQAVPVGISRDGRKLYLDVRYDLDSLVLELSEDGRLEFKAREDVQLSEGVWLEDHPRDARNSYLSFMRFRVGDKSYVIRFSAPCT